MAEKTFFKNEAPFTKRITLTEEIAQLIRQAILEGHFENGQQLTESRISEEFNISRAPVREALRELTNKGLVTHYPNRGYFLREFNFTDVEEICLLRTALEKLAVKMTVERASDDEVEELEEIVKEMETKVPNIDQASLYDYKFHQKICMLAKHRYLQEYWSLMADQMSLAITCINRSFQDASTGFVGGHREILESIRSRDVSKAEQAIEDHILMGVKNLGESTGKRNSQ